MKFTRKSIMVVLASACLLQGCSSAVSTAATLIIGENISNRMRYSNYMAIGKAWKIQDQDFRELSSGSAPNLAALASAGTAVEVNTADNTLEPFTQEDLIQYRTSRLAAGITAQGERTDVDSFLVTSLSMEPAILQEMAETSLPRAGIVLIKGLKNNSVQETIEAARVFTDKGSKVLIAPELIEKARVKRIPTVVYMSVLSNGEYGCIDKKGKQCPLTGGYTGMNRPAFGKPMQF